ncbi:hypothetical protein Ciccas_003131 [Cichlidogyrus casuarinus]|uniref:Uncharacterized protein n=1 Tax=Cichlidogyrus casuarinus TaxID=1844966 RepID=A0ABD2QF90_9PLAT
MVSRCDPNQDPNNEGVVHFSTRPTCYHCSTKGGLKEVELIEQQLRNMGKKLRLIQEQDQCFQSWKHANCVLDRFFMLIFLMIIISSTLCILFVSPNWYISLWSPEEITPNTKQNFSEIVPPHDH